MDCPTEYNLAPVRVFTDGGLCVDDESIGRIDGSGCVAVNPDPDRDLLDFDFGTQLFFRNNGTVSHRIQSTTDGAVDGRFDVTIPAGDTVEVEAPEESRYERWPVGVYDFMVDGDSEWTGTLRIFYPGDFDVNQSDDGSGGCCRVTLSIKGEIPYIAFGLWQAPLNRPGYLRKRRTATFSTRNPTLSSYGPPGDPFGFPGLPSPGAEEMGFKHTTTERWRAPHLPRTTSAWGIFGREQSMFERLDDFTEPGAGLVTWHRGSSLTAQSHNEYDTSNPDYPDSWETRTFRVLIADDSEYVYSNGGRTRTKPIYLIYDVTSFQNRPYPEDECTSDCPGGVAGTYEETVELDYDWLTFFEYLIDLIPRNEEDEIDWAAVEHPATLLISSWLYGVNCSPDADAGVGIGNSYDDHGEAWPPFENTDESAPPPAPLYGCFRHDNGSDYQAGDARTRDWPINANLATPEEYNDQTVREPNDQIISELGAMENPELLPVAYLKVDFTTEEQPRGEFKICRRFWSAPYTRTVRLVVTEGATVVRDELLEEFTDDEGDPSSFAPCPQVDDPFDYKTQLIAAMDLDGPSFSAGRIYSVMIEQTCPAP